jgi:membrane protein implicated in regulation of membrane protease activity
MVGFFLQVVIVSLCSFVLLMRMVRDRKRALKRGKGSAQEEERLFQNDAVMEEDEAVQRLYRDDDDDDDAHV